MNIWLKTFLIALAGALGALWAVLAVVVCVRIWSCVDPGFFTGLVAFTVWPLAGIIRCRENGELGGPLPRQLRLKRVSLEHALDFPVNASASALTRAPSAINLSFEPQPHRVSANASARGAGKIVAALSGR